MFSLIMWCILFATIDSMNIHIRNLLLGLIPQEICFSRHIKETNYLFVHMCLPLHRLISQSRRTDFSSGRLRKATLSARSPGILPLWRVPLRPTIGMSTMAHITTAHLRLHSPFGNHGAKTMRKSSK